MHGCVAGEGRCVQLSGFDYAMHVVAYPQCDAAALLVHIEVTVLYLLYSKCLIPQIRTVM